MLAVSGCEMILMYHRRDVVQFSRAVMKRVQSVDILRGAVVIVMALDHTRDFIHIGAQAFSPDDLSRTSPGISSRAGSLIFAPLIRGLNVYGDPRPWSPRTLISFLNCTKYPPSLSFLLMTLGPALTVMGLIENVRLNSRNPLLIFGRVPLFYFVLHLPLIHLIALVMAWVRYGRMDFFLNGTPAMGGPRKLFPSGYGWDLWVVYAVWIVTVALMYPLCRWFAALKERRQDWWLSYL